MRPWNELTLAERRKFTISHRRNARVVYEKIRKEADGESEDVTPDEPLFEPVTYSFTSYSDAEKTETWGTGTVETTGVESNGYTEVEVKTNTPEESFVGEKFYIISSAKTDGTVYELFSDAGTTSAGIYVTITQ